MSYYKITFFTLQSEKIKDSKYSAAIYSRSNGKLRINVNGVGKPKSRFSKLLMPCILAKGLIYQSKENGSFTLTDVELINIFEHLRKDYVSLNAVSYIALLLNAFVPEKMKIGRLFDDTVNFLKINDSLSLTDILLYEFYILNRLGYLPDLHNCTLCGTNVRSRDVYLDNAQLEFLCGDCVKKIGSKKNIVHFEPLFTDFYVNLRKNNIEDSNRLLQTYGFENNHIIIENFLNQFIIMISKKTYNDYTLFKKTVNSL